MAEVVDPKTGARLVFEKHGDTVIVKILNAHGGRAQGMMLDADQLGEIAHAVDEVLAEEPEPPKAA